MPTLVLLYLLLTTVNANSVTLPNGSLAVSWDATINRIKFNVKVKDGSYIAFGWGSSMANTDMVYWSANGATIEQKDLHSNGYSTPATDAVNTYTTTFT
jgi:hypothetical protein